MRIAFSLVTLAPSRVGGSETYARGLLGGFRELGVERDILVFEGDGRDRGDAGRAWQLLRAALRRRLPSDDLDVVHYPLTVPVPRFDIPSVVTLHDVRHLDLPHTSSWLERRYRALAYDRAARRASCVVVPSTHARKTAVARLGIPGERIAAIPHGVDGRRFRPGGPAPARELPDRYVLYPANLWPHKNHDRLLEAVAAIDDRELALVLTGEAYGRLPALLAKARTLGIGDRVHHLGHVAEDELPGLYRQAAALVFPSLYEGFGSPPLEAMACGCPVACSTAGALAELWSEDAVTFDPLSTESITAAIGSILHNEALREQLRERGLRRAAEFSWRVSAERHLEVYERVKRI